MTCEEIQELITALVDQELSGAELAAAEAHLRACPACALAAEQERLVKQTIRSRAQRMRAPAALRSRIVSGRQVPAGESGAGGGRKYFWPAPPALRAAMAAGLIIVLALPAFLLLRPGRDPLATAALAKYQAMAEREISSQGKEKPAEIVARLVRAAGGHMHPMGYDLSSLQMEPVAGSVEEIQGRKVIVVLYRGPGGTLFCYTFVGSEADAPANAARFYEPAKKITLYAFSRGPLNAVLHREGDLICILASEMPMNELLELTRARARPS